MTRQLQYDDEDEGEGNDEDDENKNDDKDGQAEEDGARSENVSEGGGLKKVKPHKRKLILFE